MTIPTAGARARGRITIANAIGLIAVCAAMLASVVDRRSPANELVYLSISLALPLHLLVNSRRTRSVTELAVAALAMAYLAWGALLEFRPGLFPTHWAVFDATHWVYGVAGHWLGQRPPPHPQISLMAMRWNWGLLAAFYAATLIQDTVPLFPGRSKRAGLGGSSPRSGASWPGRAWLRVIPPAAEVVLVLWFLSDWLPCLHYFGYMKCGWSDPAGVLASTVLATVHWRPRPPNWRLSRFAVRVARLVPATMAGMTTGLAWSLWGWRASGLVYVSLLVMLLPALLPSRRRRRRIPAHLLAMYWGFALSAEIVNVPDATITT